MIIMKVKKKEAAENFTKYIPNFTQNIKGVNHESIKRFIIFNSLLRLSVSYVKCPLLNDVSFSLYVTIAYTMYDHV